MPRGSEPARPEIRDRSPGRGPDLADALPRLLEWGLIDEARAAAGGLEASRVSRRNLNLRVTGRGGGGFLIKQPDPGVPDSVATLRAEGRFYAFCQREPRAAAVAELLVRLRHHQSEDAVLVLELLPGARTLWRKCRDAASAFPLEPVRALGRALGTVHATFRLPELAGNPRLGELGEDAPGSLRPHRPHPEMLRHLSPAGLELCRMVQAESGLGEALDAARAAWRVETLIHGDVRLDNVLVADSDDDGTAAIRLIDWEMVQRGDRAWDVAGVLADVAFLWLTGMSQRPELDAAARVASARTPLAVLKEGLRAFWRGYAAAAGPGRRGASGLLERAVPFAAARLIQSAFEVSGDPERPSSLEVLLLQLAANVLAAPGRAARDLFGLAPEPAA